MRQSLTQIAKHFEKKELLAILEIARKALNEGDHHGNGNRIVNEMDLTPEEVYALVLKLDAFDEEKHKKE